MGHNPNHFAKESTTASCQNSAQDCTENAAGNGGSSLSLLALLHLTSTVAVIRYRWIIDIKITRLGDFYYVHSRQTWVSPALSSGGKKTVDCTQLFP
jgi:hypothetical protein